MENLNSQLEPRRTVVTAMLSRQGAMLEELRAIAPALDPANARQDLHRLILEENFLGRSSLSSRFELHRKLAERYFRAETPRATFRLVKALQRVEDTEQGDLMAYCMFIWNDGLVYELGQQWLAPRLAGEPFIALTPDIEHELTYLSTAYPAVLTWGEVTRKRTARHYLSLLRDCGFARGTAQKALYRPYIRPSVILFALNLILGGGSSPANVPEDGLFRALGMSIHDVLDGLSELNSLGAVRFNVQGDVVQLELLQEDFAG
jgi:hypothetical protein